MLPCKQLIFAKSVGFRNLKNIKHAASKFNCFTFHQQEIIDIEVEFTVFSYGNTLNSLNRFCALHVKILRREAF